MPEGKDPPDLDRLLSVAYELGLLHDRKMYHVHEFRSGNIVSQTTTEVVVSKSIDWKHI